MYLCRACNHTSFSPCLSGPVDYPFASHHEGPGFNTRGVLMWNWSVVSLHWWTRRDYDYWLNCPSVGASLGFVLIMCKLTWSTWSHSSFVPVSRSLLALLPASQPTIGCWGGALSRACNLTSFSPCLIGAVDYPFAYCHEGPGFKTPGGYLCETGILLLALSLYIFVILVAIMPRYLIFRPFRILSLYVQIYSKYS